MQVDVQAIKTQLSRLLKLVKDGETFIIARHGRPIAQLTRVQANGLPIGIAKDDPLVPEGDAWWQPLSDQQVDEWLSPPL